ncbi:MAG: YceI family protein [Cellulophaga sp.]
MKKIILTVFAVVALLTANAQSTWKVDKSHSSINFSISHYMISDITGRFGSFDVEAITNDKFENPTFNVSIDVESIDTNQKGRDKHLKSPDFFNVEVHPKITFVSSSYKQLEDGNFESAGKITINGITKDATFNGKLNGVLKNEKDEKHKAGLTLTTKIEREAFNIGKGMSSLGKDVEVVINIEIKQQ